MGLLDDYGPLLRGMKKMPLEGMPGALNPNSPAESPWGVGAKGMPPGTNPIWSEKGYLDPLGSQDRMTKTLGNSQLAEQMIGTKPPELPMDFGVGSPGFDVTPKTPTGKIDVAMKPEENYGNLPPLPQQPDTPPTVMAEGLLGPNKPLVPSPTSPAMTNGMGGRPMVAPTQQASMPPMRPPPSPSAALVQTPPIVNAPAPPPPMPISPVAPPSIGGGMAATGGGLGGAGAAGAGAAGGFNFGGLASALGGIAKGLSGKGGPPPPQLKPMQLRPPPEDNSQAQRAQSSQQILSGLLKDEDTDLINKKRRGLV